MRLRVERRLGGASGREVLLLLAVLIAALSTYIHHPETPAPLGNLGLKYSDIVYGLFYPTFSLQKDSEEYFNSNVFTELIKGRKSCPTPYVDYHFEYPPLVAISWFFSTCVAIQLTLPEEYGPNEYFKLLSSMAVKHYSVYAVIHTLSLLALTYSASKVAESRGLSRWRVALFLIAPSTTVYLMHNWDVLASALTVASLLFFTSGRLKTSGVLLALATLSKVFPATAGLVLGAVLLARGWREKDFRGFLEFFTPFTAILTASLTTFYLLAPKGFTKMLEHHRGWYCENCLTMLLVPDIWSDTHKILSTLLVLGLLTAVTIVAIRSRGLDVVTATYLALAVPVALNYVTTPQMMLMLTPLAALALSRKVLATHLVSDSLNALIMPMFYYDLGLRSALNNFLHLNLPLEHNPYVITSPVQWVAQARNIVLVATITYLIVRYAKASPKTRSENPGGCSS